MHHPTDQGHQAYSAGGVNHKGRIQSFDKSKGSLKQLGEHLSEVHKGVTLPIIQGQVQTGEHKSRTMEVGQAVAVRAQMQARDSGKQQMGIK